MNKNSLPAEEVCKALIADRTLAFNTDNDDYLQRGTCPQCGKKELFVSRAKPWVLMCNRGNKCGFSISVRDYMPELFENFIEKYPPTKSEPNLTADTYLALNRNFDLSLIRGFYEQASWQIPDTNNFIPSIRFLINSQGAYWERLLRNGPDGRKAVFRGSYKGDAWTPPGQVLEEGDRVHLVEGCFHAIGFLHVGWKSAACMSCNNFPSNLVEAHKDKNITWVLALDGDVAGREGMEKFAEKLEALKQKYEVLLMPALQDADDLYRAGKLTDWNYQEWLWRGRLFMAKNPTEKGYIYWERKGKKLFVLDFKNSLYGYELADGYDKELGEINGNLAPDEKAKFIKSDEGKELFRKHLTVLQISNILPEFLYIQRDEETGEQEYVYSIEYQSGVPGELIPLEGSTINKPETFSGALINRTQGGYFEGTPTHLRILRKRWLNRKITMVRALPYIGYDSETKAYIFHEKAYIKGREVKLNKQGYFQIGKQGVKTKLRSLRLDTGGNFSPAWFNDFFKAFYWQGVACMAFWLGSLFAQQVRAMHKSFPFFELTGDPGSGKSTLLEFLWKLYGREAYEGFDLIKSTKAGRRRAFSQVSNLPVVIIESDRDSGIKDAKQGQFNFDELKPLFDGRGTGTLGVANRNNDTEEHTFKAALCISQNAEVEGSDALLSRIVHCHADKAHFTDGSLEIARKFQAMSSEDVGGFMRAALARTDTILNTYQKAFEHLDVSFRREIKDNRVAQNHAQIAACGYALAVLFPEGMTQERCDKLTAYLLQRAKGREARLAADHPLVELFWEQYEYINSKKTPSDLLNHAKEPGFVAINLPQFREFAYDAGQAPIDIALLKRLLPLSRKRKFVAANRAVNSRHDAKTVKCWIFENGK